MPLPKFRQLSPQSVAERRVLARVDETAVIQSQQFVNAMTQGGAAKDIGGRVLRVRASDVKALLEGRRFRFVATEGAYGNAAGGIVPDATVKAGAEAVVAHSQSAIVRLTTDLRTGAIDLDEWAVGMQSAVKNSQIAQAALARGGFANLPPPVRERIEARVFEQFDGNAKFPGLRSFLEDMAKGRYGTMQPTPGIDARALQYSSSSRAAYENEYAEVKSEAGFDEVCRVLAGGVATCSSCAEEAAKGFVPQSEAVPIGDDDCKGNCHCVQIFRRSGQSSGPAVQAAIERAQRQVELMRQTKMERMKDDGI